MPEKNKVTVYINPASLWQETKTKLAKDFGKKAKMSRLLSILLIKFLNDEVQIKAEDFLK